MDHQFYASEWTIGIYELFLSPSPKWNVNKLRYNLLDLFIPIISAADQIFSIKFGRMSESLAPVGRRI
jgi:hypothetical protein